MLGRGRSALHQIGSQERGSAALPPAKFLPPAVISGGSANNMGSLCMRVGSILRRAARLAALPLLQGADEILIGGQAVIEGVMMRSPHSFAVAVRRPRGTIAITQDSLARPSEKRAWLRYPLLRGLGVLGQSMVLGIR